MDWVDVVQVRDRRQVLLNMLMNTGFHIIQGMFDWIRKY